MAAEKQTIFELDINVDAVVSQQAKILEQQKELKKVIKEYNDATKTAEGATEDQTKAFIDAQAQMKNLSTEYRQNTTLLASRNKIEADGIKTIQDAKAALAAVSIEWARTTKIEGENSDKSKQLAANKLALTERLKELESATGDNTRNVGNYEGALKGLEGRLQSTGGGLGGLASGFVKSAKEGTLLKDGIGLINGAFKMLLANPIIAVIAAIVTVFLALKKVIAGNEEQTMKLNKIMAPFKFVLDAIMNVVQKLVDVFLNMAEAVSNVVGALIDFIGIKSDSNETVKEAIALEEREAKLKEEARKNLVKDSEAEAKIIKLRAEAADKQNLTAKQRIEKLKEAGKLSQDIADREAKQAKEELAIAEQRASRNKSSEEDLQRIAELKAKVNQAQMKADQLAITLQGQLNSAIKENEAEESAAAKEKQEKRKESNQKYIALLTYELNYFKATNESKLKDGVRIDAALVEAEQKRIDKIFELETKANEKNFKLGLISQQDYNLKKVEIDKQYSDSQLAITNAQLKQTQDDLAYEIREFQATNESKLKGQKELNDELVANEVLRIDKLRELQIAQIEASTQTERDKQLAILELNNSTNEQIAAIEKQYAEQKAATAQEQALLLAETENEIKKQGLLSQFDAERAELESWYKEKLDKAKGNADAELALAKLYSDKNKQIAQKELSTKLDLAAGFANNLADIFGRQTKVGKAAASAAVAIDTIKGSMAAFVAFQTLPPPFGQILGAAAAAAVAVKGAKAIKDIWAVPENGGTTSAGSSSGGGGGGSTTITPRQITEAQNYDGGFGNSVVNNQGGNNAPIVQPVLVVDDVTYKQNQASAITKISTQ